MPPTNERPKTYLSFSDESASDHKDKPQQNTNLNGINSVSTLTRKHSQKSWGAKWMCRMSFWASCTTNDRRFAISKTTPGSIPEIQDYEPQFRDQQYQRDLYWDDDVYDQEKLGFRNSSDKSLEQIEDDDIITDSHVPNKLRYPLIDLWTGNPQLPPT